VIIKIRKTFMNEMCLPVHNTYVHRHGGRGI
jgi:hypothetical protein